MEIGGFTSSKVKYSYSFCKSLTKKVWSTLGIVRSYYYEYPNMVYWQIRNSTCDDEYCSSRSRVKKL